MLIIAKDSLQYLIMKQNLYLDINVLQTIPSANLNRDDTGAPKTALYGGVTRSRVSSQAWKHVMRQAFAEQTHNAAWANGLRTKRGPEVIAQAILSKDETHELKDAEAMKLATTIFKQAGIKVDEDKTTKQPVTGALMMLSQVQIDQLADYALANRDQMDKKQLKLLFNQTNALDMALFGRMVAGDPSLSIDAASQVAHAISTHEVTPEYDYYTAMDDLKPEDQNGASMLNNMQYNSATLYRYANVNVNELKHNLDDDQTMLNGLKLFLQDFIMTMPTGKQNSYANKTLPQYVMINLRQDTPVNLVSAFEEPVRSEDGFVQPSIKKLEREYQKSQKFVDAPLATLILTTENSKLDQAFQQANLKTLLDNTMQAVKRALNNENAHD